MRKIRFFMQASVSILTIKAISISITIFVLTTIWLPNVLQARTFIIPHFMETVGGTFNTPNVFDTQIFFTYSGGLIGATPPGLLDSIWKDSNLFPIPGGQPEGAGSGATIDIFLFDTSGQVLKSATNLDVCNPCTTLLSAANRKAVGSIEGLIQSRGGFPSPTVTGFMILDVKGDADDVSVNSFLVNSHTGPNDLATIRLAVYDLEEDPDSSFRVINHFREDSQMPDQAPSFSEELHVFLAHGFPGTPSGNGTAQIQLSLYDDITGQPLKSATNQDVCNSCTMNLSTAEPKKSFDYDQLIRNAGGFPRPDITGFSTVNVISSSRDVLMQQIQTLRHSTFNNVDQSGIRPEALPTSNRVIMLPHILEKTGKVTNTQFTLDTQIFATYSGGLPNAPGSGNGATVDFYLFDELDSLPLKSATNQDVCNPCTVNLNTANRKAKFDVDDLIIGKGGFPRDVVHGFGLAVLAGADLVSVGIHGYVINAKLSEFDLSVFEFPPALVALPTDNPSLAPNISRRTLFREYDLPHFRERIGKTSSVPFTFDTEISAVYSGGLAGLPNGGGATLDLYLFDQNTSQPVRSTSNQEVCNPCTYTLNNSNRKRRIVIDDLITSAGGFPGIDVRGFAKIKVRGDADNVSIQGIQINSHSGANDLSISALPHQLRTRRETDFDFDGDGKADIGVFRPNDPNGATWYISNSSNNQFSAFRWGSPGDKLIPADRNGDGRTDLGVWRPTPAEPTFWFFSPANAELLTESLGLNDDLPTITADFDGDRKADPAVYREGASPGMQSHFFYRGTLNNPLGNITFIPWGQNGDRPLRGDFDGDGRADAAVFRPSDGVWYMLQSRDNSSKAERWGLSTDRLVPGDYDGDGITDLAVFRNGVWYIRRSSDGTIRIINWGLPTDTLVPADYDGDGEVDPAIYRDGVWYFLDTTNGQIRIEYFGLPLDQPFQCITDTAAFATCP